MEWQRLLLFSPETHQSLIAIYNHDWWVVTMLAGAAGAGALGWLFMGHSLHLRLSLALLSVNWLWIGIVFHARYYATINWVAYVLSALCIVMALQLLRHSVSRSATGRIGPPSTRRGGLGLAWLLVSVGWGPITVLLVGGEFGHGRYFGTAPEVVAWTTLAIVLLSNIRRWGWLLVLAPITLAEALTARLLSDPVSLTMWSLFAVSFVAHMVYGSGRPDRG